MGVSDKVRFDFARNDETPTCLENPEPKYLIPLSSLPAPLGEAGRPAGLTNELPSHIMHDQERDLSFQKEREGCFGILCKKSGLPAEHFSFCMFPESSGESKIQINLQIQRVFLLKLKHA